MTLWSYIRSTDISYLRNTVMIILDFPYPQTVTAFDELHQAIIRFKGEDSVILYVESAREKEVIRDLLGPIMSDNNIVSISWSKIK